MAGRLESSSGPLPGSDSPVPPAPSSPKATVPSVSLAPAQVDQLLSDSKPKGFDFVSDGHAQCSSRWADIVRKDSLEARSELKFFPPLAGGVDSSIISPPPEVINQGHSFWGFTLVGYFFEAPPHFMAVKANKIWSRFGLTHTAGNEAGYFFFRFSTMEMMDKCLHAGPWLMAGKAIFLKRWSPGMILNKDEHKRFPIWIKLFNLPIEYWTHAGLSWVASAVGFPRQLDPMVPVATPPLASLTLFPLLSLSNILKAPWSPPLLPFLGRLPHGP